MNNEESFYNEIYQIAYPSMVNEAILGQINKEISKNITDIRMAKSYQYCFEIDVYPSPFNDEAIKLANQKLKDKKWDVKCVKDIKNKNILLKIIGKANQLEGTQ